MLKAAGNAAQAIKGNTAIQPSQLHKDIIQPAHPISLNPREVEKLRKAEVMKKAYEIAKNYHNSIQQVTVRYLDEEQNVLIANSEGKLVEDRRVRSRLAIQSIAVEGNQMQPGFYGPGAHKGFEFMENLNLEHYANEASRIAVTMLGAGPCPRGNSRSSLIMNSAGLFSMKPADMVLKRHLLQKRTLFLRTG
ncbi:hypothetical protein NCCP133_21030 [Cytobacillus sp. NCCP-133]|nr:hypothetical protein NCCP133_21030 [Cytobacillus sp. NCCP-133]